MNEENSRVLEFVEKLGIELLPYQKELLITVSKLPKGVWPVYGRTFDRVNTEHLIHILRVLGYAMPDLDNEVMVIRKSDIGNDQLGFRSTATFMDEDIIKTTRG